MRKFILLAAIAAIGLVACNKSDVENQLPMQKAPSVDFEKQPYTYLQNKYIDHLLAYEFKKQGQSYDSEKYSYDEKREMVDILDLEKEKDEYKETEEDVAFYTEFEKKLMSEINSHFYIKKFVERFALKEVYDENDMIINMGLGDTDNLSKFQILYCYEVGFDVFGKCLEREKLTGEEEWSLELPQPQYPKGMEIEEGEPSNSPPIQKAVRYTLHSKWGSRIDYLSLNASSTAKARLRSAMNEWQSAANNKFKFYELTTNLTWYKTCWVMGWKWFVRLSRSSTNVSWSYIGYVPWAEVKIMDNPPDWVCRHELGHTLGLYHEHQRPDRDDYVKYYSNNVESGQGSQFSKMVEGSYNYHGSTFDFNSIMLYSSWTFGKIVGGVTQTPLTKKDGTTTWDYIEHISATDKTVIQKIYP